MMPALRAQEVWANPRGKWSYRAQPLACCTSISQTPSLCLSTWVGVDVCSEHNADLQVLLTQVQLHLHTVKVCLCFRSPTPAGVPQGPRLCAKCLVYVTAGSTEAGTYGTDWSMPLQRATRACSSLGWLAHPSSHQSQPTCRSMSALAGFWALRAWRQGHGHGSVLSSSMNSLKRQPGGEC